MTENEFTDLALSFPGTETRKHFDRTGFRVTGKRMFATYLDKNNSANIFLTPKEQKVFCQMDKGIYPVPNKWGEKEQPLLSWIQYQKRSSGKRFYRPTTK